MRSETSTPETVTEPSEAPYDRYGEAYRTWIAPIIAPSVVRLLDRLHGRLEPDRAMELIDVGVGTGTLALAALERWPRASAIGVDPSRLMLQLAAEEARSRGGGLADRLRLVPAGAERLPLPDGTVDLALSSFVIQLVSSRAAALREMHRVLRSGGVVAVLTWQDDDEPFEPEDVVQAAIDELDVEAPNGGQAPRPYTSPPSAAAEFRRIGFREAGASLEWLEHQFTPQSYVGVVEHWNEDDVFAAIEEPARAELRSRILRELELLPPEALLWRRPLVSVVARKP